VTDSRLLFEGKYEILAKVREGGMGAIYKVRHRLLDEVRVIKVMRAGAGEPELETRFLHEAKIATRLRHPNLCATHDFAFDEEGTAYLVMEYVDGVNLAEFMKQRGLPGVPLTLEIAHQALLALGYLHRKGVVHRDVAPDNLMLAFDEDGRPLVKLIDLGIARVADRDADLTANGIFLGKPRYASPEQLGSLPPGEKLDGRSDLYCLGVVLYELLTGRLPFEGKSPADLLRAQQLNRILPFEESDPQARVPTDLRAVVLQALERKRSERFQTADEFDRAVVALQGRFSGPRHEITPEIAAAIRRAPSAASEIAAVRAVDPDPLHTVRLPFERPVASGPVSVEDVLIGNGPPALDDDRFDRSLPPRSAARSTPVAPRDISAALPHDMGTPL